MAQSTKSARPRKPHPDHPLFAHPNGQWAKKVRGKIHFFGVWRDSDAALKKWNKDKDALLSGMTPRSRDADGKHTIADLCNRFLTTKSNLFGKADAAELLYRQESGRVAPCGRNLGASTGLMSSKP